MKLCTIIGARPQFIKAAAVSRAIAKHNARTSNFEHIVRLAKNECSGIRSASRTIPSAQRRGRTLNEVIIHTGQHYDESMSDIFFRELAITKPKYNLNIGSGTHGLQTGKMLAGIEDVLIKEKPDWVLIYGDTNSTLAGALAAAKLHIPVAHIEAGLRSFNRRMPEEINRIVADRLSGLLFCPSQVAADNLAREGMTKGVYIIGDVMADALHFAVSKFSQHSNILEHLGLKPKRYMLATVHRAENTDNPERLTQIMNALIKLAEKEPVILPLHPRTKKIMKNINSKFNKLLNSKHQPSTIFSFSLQPSACISNLERRTLNLEHGLLQIIDPVGYFDMILLNKSARMILTDSGGIQKEAYWLKVPCVTLRDETEWLETVDNGWNILTGANSAKIIKAVKTFKTPVKHPPLYGSGKAAEKIVKRLVSGTHFTF